MDGIDMDGINWILSLYIHLILVKCVFSCTWMKVARSNAQWPLNSCVQFYMYLHGRCLSIYIGWLVNCYMYVCIFVMQLALLTWKDCLFKAMHTQVWNYVYSCWHTDSFVHLLQSLVRSAGNQQCTEVNRTGEKWWAYQHQADQWSCWLLW